MKLYKICFLMGSVLFSLKIYGKEFQYTGYCKKFINYSRDLEYCLDKELAGYDKELTTLYRKLNPNKALKRAEILWIAFKEADCEYIAYEVNEGKEYQFVEKICLINKTKTRIAELKRSYFYSKWISG